MTKNDGLYPNFDVLTLQDEWDAHTKEIVKKRLGPFQIKLLSPWDQKMIKTIAQHLVYDDREDILNWIATHLDEQLTQVGGESQRQPGVPPQKILILDGFKALDKWAKNRFFKGFVNLKSDQQLQIISLLEIGELEQIPRWDANFQKELFQKLLGLVVDAYYSHPWVWSEIGYGGPAYPRGYVRIELGLVDPWEPKQSDQI